MEQNMESRPKAEITVFLEPEGAALRLPRPKTVQQLLNRLKLRPTACLVIRHPASERPEAEPSPENARGGTLLTHDLPIQKDDVLTVRKVASSG